ncbi:MAG: hypothetical protein HeimC3_00020 [Candidatus Heimdallarchaeota archaeon LC_3]|nr:MAG: hypothetical protein HeimC3_00020 [Candidatus Heimdallarchaeota archaeon LC_3]
MTILFYDSKSNNSINASYFGLSLGLSILLLNNYLNNIPINESPIDIATKLFSITFLSSILSSFFIIVRLDKFLIPKFVKYLKKFENKEWMSSNEVLLTPYLKEFYNTITSTIIIVILFIILTLANFVSEDSLFFVEKEITLAILTIAIFLLLIALFYRIKNDNYKLDYVAIFYRLKKDPHIDKDHKDDDESESLGNRLIEINFDLMNNNWSGVKNNIEIIKSKANSLFSDCFFQSDRKAFYILEFEKLKNISEQDDILLKEYFITINNPLNGKVNGSLNTRYHHLKIHGLFYVYEEGSDLLKKYNEIISKSIEFNEEHQIVLNRLKSQIYPGDLQDLNPGTIKKKKEILNNLKNEFINDTKLRTLNNCLIELFNDFFQIFPLRDEIQEKIKKLDKESM